ncbi:MAG: hypothetical protein ACO3P1_07915 [Pseudomonadales bacterium]|jgi:hypothetical protein
MELEDLFEGRDVLADWLNGGGLTDEAERVVFAEDETPWVDAYEV